MFKPNTALYMRDLTFKTETIDSETRKIVVIAFMSQPFQKDMANELNIGRHLFSLETGDPLDDIISVDLAIATPLQTMTLKMAPDQPSARIIIPDVQISKKITVRRDKEGPVLAATFTASFRYPDGDTLLYLANGVNNQHFVTFEQQQAEMFPEGGKQPGDGQRVGDINNRPARCGMRRFVKGTNANQTDRNSRPGDVGSCARDPREWRGRLLDAARGLHVADGLPGQARNAGMRLRPLRVEQPPDDGERAPLHR